MSRRPELHDDAAALAERIVRETGGDVVLGLPLGIGKANHVANALFAVARDDPGVRLRIFTALTLEAPTGSNTLERRFLEPMVERVFAGYPALAYAEALRGDGLPANVEVNEFFLQAGNWLKAPAVQQNYISANYTHAAEYLLASGANVLAQLVAPPPDQGQGGYSVSGNSDITLDILHATRARGGRCLLVGQTNAELPFMPGEAVLPADAFDHVLTGHDFPLFAPPNMPVTDADHAIGLRAAALVPDGGSIQIGIGSIGDAFGAALIMRHEAPRLFAETLARLDADPDLHRHILPFDKGLYGISEMFVPVFLELYRRGVLKRPAADGGLLHGGFFLGPRRFYDELRAMPETERGRFQMRAISFINALYGDEESKRRDRTDARFINNAMLVTALGAATSDALEDGRVISGVGGQYNFVAQAFALDGARSIITVPATRSHAGETSSNVVWSYGHTTIPRHLRDIVVSEYGTADLRGRSDRDCVAAMIGLADARFRADLATAARKAGKIEDGFRSTAAANTPDRIRRALKPARAAGWCGRFPFGTDFTDEEQRLMPALQRLETLSHRPHRLAAAAARSLTAPGPDADERVLLRRLQLDEPASLKERAYQRLVLGVLRDTG